MTHEGVLSEEELSNAIRTLSSDCEAETWYYVKNDILNSHRALVERVRLLEGGIKDNQCELVTDTEGNLWVRNLIAQQHAALTEELEKYRNGYKGGCYACETVATQNIALRERVKRLERGLTSIINFISIQHCGNTFQWIDDVAKAALQEPLTGAQEG